MKRIFIAIAALICVANAFASGNATSTPDNATPAARACPPAAWLAQHYGISFSGFTTPIPAAKAPDVTHSGAFVRLAIP